MAGKPQTVLVVEDEASIASFVAALSEERRLHRADDCKWHEALKLVAWRSPRSSSST